VIRRTIATCVLLGIGALGAHERSPQPAAKPGQTMKPEQTKALNLAAYAELLRSDVRAQKVAIITEVMGFTEAEDKAFWPIYREYDLEMAKLGDERVGNIEEYARNYSQLTDEVADRLATKALDLEARRHAVKAKFYERVKTALSPKTALRVLQVEHQLQLIVDLQVAASLPIAQ
jgi:hypothetical protein